MLHEKTYLTALIVLLLFSLVCCTKEKGIPAITPQTPETDSALFVKAGRASSPHFYKDDSMIYTSSPAAAHKAFFRVRFNDIARNALTDNGKLPAGAAFPTGSVIVKELHNDAAGTALYGYAIMEKLPSDPNAAEQWIWAEYTSTTAPTGILIADKGMQCTSCHSTNDRDKVRLFNLFP